MSLIATFLNNRILNPLGIHISRFPNEGERRLIKYLKENNINLCFDVGANQGQFAKKLISIGFEGDIFSFEPQTNAFNILEKVAANYKNWKVFKFAFGDEETETSINISENSYSSSILNILDTHVKAAPKSVYINKETIEVKTLSSFYNQQIKNRPIFLKIDTQGYEAKVLQGALHIIDNVKAIQIEMSCVELYSGEKLFDDMKQSIEKMGFKLLSIENGYANTDTCELLQIECIFIR